jgi:hypothetical protein
LLQKYSGLYEIRKILGFDRFVIADLQGAGRSQRPYEDVVSVDKMKPYDLAAGSDIESSSDSEDKSNDEQVCCFLVSFNS